MIINQPPAAVATVLNQVVSFLKRKNNQAARLEAEVLLSTVLGWTRTRLLASLDTLVPGEVQAHLSKLVKQRESGYPLQYLTGHCEFMSLDLFVNPSVLIPRPDTEVLVETALELIQEKKRPVIVDVGTGSGAIALALAHYLPHSLVYATDIAAEALAVAKRNACALGLVSRLHFLHGDLLHPFLQGETIKFDLIVANPPYIPSAQLATLPPEVSYEPRQALDGGPDGLDVYRRLFLQAGQLLTPGGYLTVEIGHDQAKKVQNLLQPAAQWHSVVVHQDYGRRDRVVVARKEKEQHHGHE